MYKEFKKGEMSEGYPWRISFDEEILLFKDKDKEMLCEHIYYKRKGNWLGHPDFPTGERYGIPRAIVCINEGGFNSAVLCLDCLLKQINGL